MENISAKEVEDLLFEHPQVGDVAVIGLPDERTGERVVAIVVTAEGQEPISFEQMKEHLRRQGAPQAGPPRAARVPRRPAAEPDGQGRQVRAPGSATRRQGCWGRQAFGVASVASVVMADRTVGDLLATSLAALGVRQVFGDGFCRAADGAGAERRRGGPAGRRGRADRPGRGVVPRVRAAGVVPAGGRGRAGPGATRRGAGRRAGDDAWARRCRTPSPCELDLDLAAPVPDGVEPRAALGPDRGHPAVARPGPGPRGAWSAPGSCGCWTGKGVVEHLQRFAAQTGLPVVNTWGAKGVFAWDSPFHAGTAGLQARDFELAGLTDKLAVVCVGVDEDELLPARRRPAPRPAPGPPRLRRRGLARADRRTRPGRRSTPTLSAVVGPAYASDETPLHPARATRDLGELRPPGGLVVADPGPAGFWVARAFPTTEPGSVLVPATDAPGTAAAAALLGGLAGGRPALGVTTLPLDPMTEAVLDLARGLEVALTLEAWATSPGDLDPRPQRLGRTSEALRRRPGVDVLPVPVDLDEQRPSRPRRAVGRRQVDRLDRDRSPTHAWFCRLDSGHDEVVRLRGPVGAGGRAGARAGGGGLRRPAAHLRRAGGAGQPAGEPPEGQRRRPRRPRRALPDQQRPSTSRSLLAAYKLRAVPINVNYRYVEDELRYLFADAGARRRSSTTPSSRTAWRPIRDELPDLDGRAGPRPGLRGGAGRRRPGAGRRRPQQRRPLHPLHGRHHGHAQGRGLAPGGRLPLLHRRRRPGPPAGRHHHAGADRRAHPADRVRGVFLPVAPLMHAAGQWTSLSWLFAGGKVVLLPGSLEPDAVWQTIADEGVHMITIVGDAVARPAARRLGRGRRLRGPDALHRSAPAGRRSARPCASASRQILPNVFLADGFGSSETGAQGTARMAADSDARAAFAPMDDTTVVLDEDLAAGGAGLRGRGPGRPHRPHPAALPRRPREDGGHLRRARRAALGHHRRHGHGRRGRHDQPARAAGSGCINTGGEKVFPEEVESVLRARDDVYDVLVVGAPDERWGERVAAIVQPADGHRADAPRSSSTTAGPTWRATRCPRPCPSSTRSCARPRASPTTAGPRTSSAADAADQPVPLRAAGETGRCASMRLGPSTRRSGWTSAAKRPGPSASS